MKTTFRLIGFLIAAGMTGPLALVTAQDAPAQPEAAPNGALKVAVEVPPSWRADVNYDFVAEDFGGYLGTVFRRMGFPGEVEYVSPFDEHPENGYTLDLRIIRWRMNRIGNVECVFSADLQTPSGEKHLGVFSDISLGSITGHDRMWLAESFRDAAEGAIRELYREVAKSELVPGVRAS